jgi:hypothetical protein
VGINHGMGGKANTETWVSRVKVKVGSKGFQNI